MAQIQMHDCSRAIRLQPSHLRNLRNLRLPLLSLLLFCPFKTATAPLWHPPQQQTIVYLTLRLLTVASGRVRLLRPQGLVQRLVPLVPQRLQFLGLGWLGLRQVDRLANVFAQIVESHGR